MLRNCRSYAILSLSLAIGVATAALGQPKTISGTRDFLYLSDQRVITLEVVNSQRIILNYINLGKAYELVEAPQVVLQDQSGVPHRGHVIAIEPAPDPGERYVVSRLIEPRKFDGLTIWGDFEMEAPCARAYLKTGGRIMELEPMIADDFERATAMIQDINLDLEDAQDAVRLAGFHRGFGSLYFAGSSEADKLEGLFAEADPRPPIPLDRPAPLLPSAFASLPDPVIVKLRLLVGQAGGLYKFEVLEAPDPALGERAVETVKNSWKFLPGISKGKVADVEITLRVTFRR